MTFDKQKVKQSDQLAVGLYIQYSQYFSKVNIILVSVNANMANKKAHLQSESTGLNHHSAATLNEGFWKDGLRKKEKKTAG